MPSVVVDASALVDILIGAPAAGRLFDRLIRSGDRLHAPHSIDLEVANAVRRLWTRGLLADRAVTEMASVYSRFEIKRHAHRPLLHRVWDLRYNITA